MPARHALTVFLTPELAGLVAANVSSGAYGSAREVVQAGLHPLFDATLNIQDAGTQDAACIGTELLGVDNGTDPFVAAPRMPMVVTDPRQHDNPVVFINDAFCKILQARLNRHG